MIFTRYFITNSHIYFFQFCTTVYLRKKKRIFDLQCDFNCGCEFWFYKTKWNTSGWLGFGYFRFKFKSMNEAVERLRFHFIPIDRTDRPNVLACKLANQRTYLHSSIPFHSCWWQTCILYSDSRVRMGWKQCTSYIVQWAHGTVHTANIKCYYVSADVCWRVMCPECVRARFLPFLATHVLVLHTLFYFECFYLPRQSTKQTTENYNYLLDDFCVHEMRERWGW